MNNAWHIEAMDSGGDIYTRTFIGEWASWSESEVISHVESQGGIVISIERVAE